ncbi:substrate-binding periplasmic protein [Bdellovibrio svalbardensis]|uniref:Transporter substrate-binding domain-containing protein n=1 Tax=Bdellovibrio svalbardensis TaxID=2972972 RepID=A0ABT6DRE3_9BACT|nr:transporter substrate-binding domain-containing protein [Bdellovibrio svalbardensis]MDG0817728.1 transporter substrate-binding domain-containing protein [Bdellovibrio svalbardensis]
MKIILGLFLLFSPVLAQSENTPLTMGMPFRYSRNPALNEYLSLMTASLKDAGFDVVIKTFETKRTYDLVIDGDVDAIPYDDLASTENRDKVVTMSFPILKTYARIFYRADNKSFDPKNLKKLKGALARNNVLIDQEAKKKSLKFVTANSPFHGIKLLLDHEVDYFLAIEEVGLGAINSTPEAKSEIKMSEVPFAEVPIYVTLQKSFKKDLPKIEAAFKKNLQGNLTKYPLIQSHLNKEAK